MMITLPKPVGDSSQNRGELPTAALKRPGTTPFNTISCICNIMLCFRQAHHLDRTCCVFDRRVISRSFVAFSTDTVHVSRRQLGRFLGWIKRKEHSRLRPLEEIVGVYDGRTSFGFSWSRAFAHGQSPKKSDKRCRIHSRLFVLL